MTRKYSFPQSKVRSRPDVDSKVSTIPRPIVKQLHIRDGDFLQWIVTRSGDEEYVKLNVLRK